MKMVLLSKYCVFLLCLVCNFYGYVFESSPESFDTGSDSEMIHCYCNLPSCITSSYMCKSEDEESACFKKFEPATQKFLYGCFNSISKEMHCMDSSDQMMNSSFKSKAAYNCCFSDMCNNDQSEQNFVHENNRGLHAYKPDEGKMKDITLENFEKSSTKFYTNKEIWFRAVLIAVPICGLMVLVILITIAARMLKSDSSQRAFSSSNLEKRMFNGSNLNRMKTQPRAENDFKNQAIPKYDMLGKKLSIVFKSCQEKNDKWENNGNSNHLQGNSVCNQFEPKVHEKISKQNFNILKLPYKLSEFKNKNKYYYKNLNVSNNDCCRNANTNNSSIVTIDSELNYRYNLIDNCLH